MKPHDRDRELAAVILKDCETLRKRILRFSVTKESFIEDRTDEGELAYDALMSPVYRIAEDALHLSDSLQSRYSDYPWNDIRGFRNFVAHGYREVDRAIAWKVVVGDIPELESILKSFLTDYDTLAARAYKAPINSEGVAVLPSDWKDE